LISHCKKKKKNFASKKALQIAPRPVAGLLRPIVQCPTVRYNFKQRQGKGFTLEELKKAGVDRRSARNIGIAVDFRRRNKNEEHLARNVARLKEYKSKLILFPRNPQKPKKKDAKAEEVKNATQNRSHVLLPFPSHTDTQVLQQARVLTEDEKNPKKSAVAKLRRARMAKRMESRRKIQLTKKKRTSRIGKESRGKR